MSTVHRNIMIQVDAIAVIFIGIQFLQYISALPVFKQSAYPFRPGSISRFIKAEPRHKNDEGSTWRENKLGVVYSSDHIYYWKNKKGEREHRITKRDYVS